MNCQHIHTQLDDFLDGQLNAEQQQQFQAHLTSCSSCHESVTEAQTVQSALTELPTPAMRPGFAQQAMQRTVGKRHQRRGVAIGFSSALMAGLALFVVSGGLLPTLNSTTSLPDVAISVQSVQTINLAFDSVNYVESATLTIALPDHIEFVGYPGLKQLTWQTSLKQGRNVLPLPIKALNQNNAVLQASIEINGKTKSFQTPIHVNKHRQPQASNNRPYLV